MSIHRIVDIHIPKPQSTDSKSGKRRSNSGKRKFEDDTLKRRPTGGFINIYDMGYIKSGLIYETLEYTISPTLGSGNSHRSIDVSDFDGRNSLLFAIDSSLWKSKFKKISKSPTVSQRYNIVAVFTGNPGDFLDNLEEWTDKGLKLTSDQVQNLQIFDGSGLLSSSIDLSATSSQKITSLPSFSAPSVTFTPDVSMDVFVAPSLMLSEWTTDEADSLGVIHTGIGFINGIWNILPRPWILDDSNPYFNKGAIGADYRAAGGGGFSPWSDAYDGIVAAMSLPGFRGLLPVEVSLPARSYVYVGEVPSIQKAVGVNTKDNDDIPGVFMGAIKKGNQIFYFWKP